VLVYYDVAKLLVSKASFYIIIVYYGYVLDTLLCIANAILTIWALKSV